MSKLTNNLQLVDGAKALVIVAHPDDEVIWMGGTILHWPKVRWHILCLSRQSDVDREPKFQKVMKHLGVKKSWIDDLDDEGRLKNKVAISKAERLINTIIKNNKFDYLFFHGANGEYGHPVHRIVNQAVKNLLQRKTLAAKKIFLFHYQKKDQKKFIMEPGKNPDFCFFLSKQEFTEKRRIVAEMYGYPYDGIDVNLCNELETFLSLNY